MNNSFKYKCLQSVDFSKVKITDEFWSSRIDQSLEVGIEACAEKLLPSIKNFENAALVYKNGIDTYYKYNYNSNFAADSDVYKLIESMAYAIENYKDCVNSEKQTALKKIKAYLNDWIPKIIAGQDSNGYIDTLYTLKNTVGSKEGLTPAGRFKNISWHELYCLGHLYEAAIALYNANGDRWLIDVSVKSLNLIYSAFHEKDTTYYTVAFTHPGHEEIELALIKLSLTLRSIKEYGKEYSEKSITLSRYFLDQNRKVQGDCKNGRCEALPVAELTEAWGHCVRSFYLYTAMTDMCLEKGDLIYKNLKKLWQNVETKTYITGGIGNDLYTEGFAQSYDLDNEHSYCETCSSISNVFWNKSMNLLFGESKYYDNIENQLYNNIISGIGLDGKHFYYQNRLTNNGGITRPEWYGTPCCPTNLMRLMQKLGGYIYTKSEDAININLYIGNRAEIMLKNSKVGISIKTGLPWNGNSLIELFPQKEAEFTLRLRFPKWATAKNTLLVNGAKCKLEIEKGYICIKRTWKTGDKITADFPLTCKIIDNSNTISTNRGLVAVTKGPVVYALEQLDNTKPLQNCTIPQNAVFKVIKTNCFAKVSNPFGTQTLDMLYVSAPKSTNAADTVKLIPFYAWANRTPTPMRVYLKKSAKSE